MSRKINIDIKLLVTLWIAILITTVGAIGTAGVFLLSVLGYKEYVLSPEDVPIAICLIVLNIFLWFIWKISTFRRRDFINLAASKGFQAKNSIYYPALIDIFSVYSFARGFIGNIYVVGKFDIPFFAYSPYRRISPFKPTDKGEIVMSGDLTPTYMTRESQIEFFSLNSGLSDSSIDIYIEKDKRSIPETRIEEIDKTLEYFLKDVKDFHARLFSNGDCLRLAIIGGSWLGKKFGERIRIGLDIFRHLNGELKDKYPLKNWDGWEVKWNRKEEQFYLQKNI